MSYSPSCTDTAGGGSSGQGPRGDSDDQHLSARQGERKQGDSVGSPCLWVMPVLVSLVIDDVPPLHLMCVPVDAVSHLLVFLLHRSII